jgi:serine/threonine protein kinase
MKKTPAPHPNLSHESAWKAVEELFHQALRKPAAERESWLKSQTAVEVGIRDEARSLVAAFDRHEELSRQEPAEPESKIEPALPRSGRFGAYRLEKLIGAGGMGAVYLASRNDGEFQQQVAIKVMALHLEGSAFLHSFRHERQILANLNHPNITRLLDGGVSDAGEPYLVMEYVNGKTIDQYCDSRRLSLEARLNLFVQVCHAVECAHRNLIVHRDLKPGNILVDTEGTVKLLDFGTAKLLGDQAPAATQAGLMTPRYASPEQLRAEPVTTASDVFSLGVILYELLTGAWPFGNPKSALDELDRLMRGRTATKPAEAITEQAAERRSVSRERLRREIAGDLSTILLKMLAAEPAQRYGSVAQVEEDLERYRERRPILARPQTTSYAVRKFVARNWLGVSAAGLAVLTLLALAVFSFHQSVQAREQAARAQRVSEFAKNTFLSASSTWQSPLRGQSRAIQFSDILDNAVERVGKEFANDPLAEADLRGTLGSTYAVLGDPAKGEAQILLAIQRLRATADGGPRIAADLHARLCDARSYQGHYAEALTACQDALALARVHGSSLSLGGILHDTAYMAVKSGARLEEAEALYREALFSGPTDQDRAKLWPAIVNTRIGYLRLLLGDLDEGNRLLKGAEHQLRAQPGPPIEIVPTLNALAFGARIRGNYGEAVDLLRNAIHLLTERPTAYMGRDQIEIELAAAEALTGKLQALARLRSVEARLRSGTFSPMEQVRLSLLSGIVEAHCGVLDSAERNFRAALATAETQLSLQPADRVEIYVRLAELLTSSGRPKQAADVARQGLRTAELAYGTLFTRHPFVSELRSVLH